MGFVGPLIQAKVSRVGSVAMTTISNRSAHVVEVVVEGTDRGAVHVKIAGNDTFRNAYTVNGDFTVRELDGEILYPLT